MSPHFELPRLRTLARHAIPHLVEATLVPLGLFYLTMWLLDVWGALMVALGWSALAILRRVVVGQRVPGILLLGMLGLVVRTALAFASGSVFLYFLQPSLGSLVVGGAFLLSVSVGRPLAERLASDFCPLPDHVLAHSATRRIFRRISLLWAFVNIANAAVAVWLLLTQPLPTYLAARTSFSIVCTVSAVALSTVWFKAMIRRHGISAEPAGGSLLAT